MATRDENLKKINDELEKLDDEQLEQVAGGMIPPRGGYKIVPTDDAILQDGLEPPKTYGTTINWI